MPTIPSLPQRGLPGGLLPSFAAPDVVPPVTVTGRQTEALGAAVGGLGLGLMDVGGVLQAAEDEARGIQAFNRWSTEAQPILAGYLTSQGEQALGDYPKLVQEQLRDLADHVSEGLTDTQAQRFRDRFSRRMVELQGSIEIHHARELQTFSHGQADALATTEANGAIIAYQQPPANAADAQRLKAIGDRHLALAEAQKRRAGEIVGLSREEIDLNIQEMLAGVDASVVDGMISQGRPDEARLYWDGVDKSKFTPQDRQRIDSRVTAATMKQRAEDLSLDILTEAISGFIGGQVRALGEALGMRPPTTTPAPTQPRALQLRARAMEILDAKDLPVEMQDLVRDRIEFRVGERLKAEAIESNTAVVQAETVLASNPGLMPSQLPLDLQERLLRGGKWADIVQFSGRMDYPNDPGTWQQVSMMTDEEYRLVDRDVFLQLINTRLDRTHADQAMARWRSAHNQASAEDKDRIGWSKRIERRAVDAGWLRVTDAGTPTVTDDDVWQRIWRIESEVDRQIGEFQRASGGKPPSGDEAQKIIDDVFADSVYSYKGPNIPDAPISALTQEQLAEATRVIGGHEIPALVYLALRDQQRRIGEKQDDLAILDAWVQLGRPATVDKLRERR